MIKIPNTEYLLIEPIRQIVHTLLREHAEDINLKECSHERGLFLFPIASDFIRLDPLLVATSVSCANESDGPQ